MLQRVTFLTFAIFSIFVFTGQVQAQQQVGVAPAYTFNVSNPDYANVGIGGELAMKEDDFGWTFSLYRSSESSEFRNIAEAEATRLDIMTGPLFQVNEYDGVESFVSFQFGMSHITASASVGDIESEDTFRSGGIGSGFGFMTDTGHAVEIFMHTGARYFFETDEIEQAVKPYMAVGVNF